MPNWRPAIYQRPVKSAAAAGVASARTSVMVEINFMASPFLRQCSTGRGDVQLVGGDGLLGFDTIVSSESPSLFEGCPDAPMTAARYADASAAYGPLKSRGHYARLRCR